MQYDVIIVGGGLVGLSLALALQDTKLRIAVINARLPQHDDPRLFALNYSSCQLFNNLGLWSAISSQAAPIHKVHVSYRGRFGAVRLHHQDVGLATLGHVIPAKEIELALQQKITELNTITLYQPAKLISLKIENNATKVLISNEMHEQIELQACLIIGADGNDSTVRKELNISTDEYNYQQSAIVTRITLQRVRSQEKIAYERFYADGAIAMLPLVDDQYAMIWTAKHANIDELMNLSDDLFLQTLQKTFGYRLGRLLAISKRYTYPLRLIHAQKLQKNNIFLIGNSAHALHPIAAQGFNLALYEVAILAEHLQASDTNIANIDFQYITDRIYKQQQFSMSVSHRLANLQTSPIINQYSQLGMLFLDLAMPVKRYFINHLLGRSGRVPQLLLRDSDNVVFN